MLCSFSIPYSKSTSASDDEPSNCNPSAMTGNYLNARRNSEERTNALAQGFLALKLHLMKLADGKDAAPAFVEVGNQIIQKSGASQSQNLIPIQGANNLLANVGQLLPSDTGTLQLATNSKKDDAFEVRECWLCKQQNALPDTWVCHNCTRNCWICKNTGAELRHGLYWMCDGCQNTFKCLFCGTPGGALSYHFGVPACETCKGRYRRREKTHQDCKKGSNCKDLKNCTACWYTQCLPVWKDLHAKSLKSNSGRKQKRQRTEITEEEDDDNSSNQTSDETSVNLLDGLFKTSYDSEKDLDILYLNESERIDYVKGIIAEKDPLAKDFNALNENDQNILLKQTSSEVSALRYGVLRVKEIVKDSFMNFCTDVAELLRICREQKISVEELELLTAIVIFSSDQPGLSQSDLIESTEQRYIEALRAKAGSDRSFSLVLKLRALKKLSRNIAAAYDHHIWCLQTRLEEFANPLNHSSINDSELETLPDLNL